MASRFVSFFLVFHAVASGVFAGQARENSTGVPGENVKLHGGNVESGRQGRAMGNSIYAGFITCAFQYDAACFVDVAKKYLDAQKRELLAQADEEVSRANPNTSLSNKPSQIASSIEKLFSELTNLFRDGLSSFFGKGDDEDAASETKEVAEDEEDDEEDDDDKKDNSSRDVGEGRKLKKKKKGPIKKLFAAIKLGILAVVVVVKISLVIKLFEAALKLKLVLIGAGAVFLQGLKLWLEFRNRKHEESGIIYHNPHHGDVGGFGEAEFAGPGEFHGREDNFAQNLAYNSYAHDT